MKINLKIGHLYPRRMNIYGDRGNIASLTRRADWRGWRTEVEQVEVGRPADLDRYDLLFFGGGQDQEQVTVAKDLQQRAAELRSAVETGTALLAVCGGYQLLGRYYQPEQGDRLEGVGLFDAYTETGPKRLIGNVVADCRLWSDGPALVGFENHSGLTRLGESAQPLAKIRSGFGNDGQDGTEGCVYRGAIGTYLHGSLLPKNPKLADWLLQQAAQRRHPGVRLSALPDSLETQVNRQLAGRFA